MGSALALLLSFTLLLLHLAAGHDELDYIFERYRTVCKTKRSKFEMIEYLGKLIDDLDEIHEGSYAELRPVISSLSYAIEATKGIYDGIDGDVKEFNWHCKKMELLYKLYKHTDEGKREAAREALEEFETLTEKATKEEDKKEAIEIMKQFEPMEKRLNDIHDSLKESVEEGSKRPAYVWACARFLKMAHETVSDARAMAAKDDIDNIVPALSAAIATTKPYSVVAPIKELTEEANLSEDLHLEKDLQDLAKSLTKLFRFQYLWGYDVIAAYEKVLNPKTAGSKGSTPAARGNAGLQAKGKAIKQKRRRQKRRQRK